MKKIFALFLVLTLLSPIVPTVSYAQAPSVWAEEAVEELKSTGDFDANRFTDYQKPITRLEFIYFAVRLLEIISGQEIQVDAHVSFNDTSDVWALKGATVGITSGVGNGQFAPNSILNREQLATMLVKTMQLANLPLSEAGEYRFADDSQISSWAKEAMYIARENSILGGVGNDMAAPKQSATVEQCITLINRVLSNYNDIAEDGFDSISYEGGTYTGEIKDNLPNGFGALIASVDGGEVKFIGEWKDGSMDGQGIIYASNGVRMIGNMKDTSPDGQCILVLPDVGIYEGQFKNGELNGEGTVITPDGTAVKGQWSNDELVGDETVLPDYIVNFTLETGSYVGEADNGMAEGFGTFTWNNGNVYEGQYKDGEMHGLGILTLSDGVEYAGEFNNSTLIRGIVKRPDRSLYVGGFNDFKFNGRGILVSLDGTVKYVGGFKDGKLHGDVTFTYHGETIKGQWVNGEMVE